MKLDPTSELVTSRVSTNGHAPKAKESQRSAGIDLDGECIPYVVYDHLPKRLAAVCKLIPAGIERDVFLSACLPVAASAMPNVRTKYGHWHSLNLFVAIVAPPGSGKGAARSAARVGDPIQKRMIEESQNAQGLWEMEQEEGGSTSRKPPTRTFYLPGDSSAAASKAALKANPHGCTFETEIKSVTIAQGQDWGDNSDVILKAFQNEPISTNRKGEEPLYIPHPAPSYVLTGTPGSIFNLIPDTEDGRFSRFCIYTFEAEPEWISQFSDEDDESLDRAIDLLGHTLNEMHRELDARIEPTKPLVGRIGEDDRRIIDSTLAEVLRDVARSDAPAGLASNVKRAGLVATRIALVLSLIRTRETVKTPNTLRTLTGDTIPSYVATRKDVLIGCILALVYLEHSIRLSSLYKHASRKNLTTKKEVFLSSLPVGQFHTSEAISAAGKAGIPESTMYRYLNAFCDNGLLEKLDHGLYLSLLSGPGESIGISERIESLTEALVAEAQAPDAAHST